MKKFTVEIQGKSGQWMKLEMEAKNIEQARELVSSIIATHTKMFDFDYVSKNLIEIKVPGRPKNDIFEIVRIMKIRGYTQEDIAQELNVSLSTIRRNWKAL